MKFTFKERHNTHDDDCWCDAIALMTEQEYDKVYKMFKPFIEYNGGVNTDIILGYFKKENYDVYKMKQSLQDMLRLYNIKNGAVLLMEDKEKNNHAVYVKGNKIYDNIDSDMMWWYIKEYTVLHIIVKLESYE